MLRLASLALLIVLAPSAHAQLAGTYTIDGSAPTAGTNYQTFADATAALESQGVSAAVTFEVAAGTYTEQVTLGTVPGASGSRRITFRGIPFLGDIPTLTYGATSAAADWVVRIDARYVTLEQFEIQVADATQALGTVVVVGSPSRSVHVTDCEIRGVGSTSPAVRAPGVLVESETSTLERLQIDDGTHGVRFRPGPGANDDFDHVARDVVIEKPRDRGIEANGMALQGPDVALTIEDTFVSYPFSPAGFVGIDVSEFDNAAMVLRNTHIRLRYGIGIRLVDISGSLPTVLVTNRVWASSGAGLDVESVEALDVSFTTLSVGGGDSAISLGAGASGTTLRNLIVRHSGFGYHLEVANGLAAAEHIVFAPASRFRAQWDGTNYISITPIQDAGLLGLDSRHVDVEFTADYHLTGDSDGDSYLVGTPAYGLPPDIDGDARDATYPYVGADEAATPLTPPEPGLSGVYTVFPLPPGDPTGPRHFRSMNGAAFALSERGADGPVTFVVTDAGTEFYGLVFLQEFRGMSPNRLVRFEAASGTTPVVPRLILNGGEHLTLDGIDVTDEVDWNGRMQHFTIENASLPGFEMSDYNSYITFDNVDVAGGIATSDELFTSSFDIRVVDSRASFVRLTGRYMTVEGSDIAGNGSGNSSRLINVDGENAAIRSNVVTGGGTGIYLRAGVNSLIGSLGASVEGNRVTVPSGSGIRILGQGPSGPPVTVANNMIVNGGLYGMNVRANNMDVHILHNSVVTLSDAGSALLVEDVDKVYANVLVNLGTGDALSVTDAAPTAEINGDVLYSAGAVLARVETGGVEESFATLAEMRAGTPFEGGGVSFLPTFEDLNTGDIHLAGGSTGDARFAVSRGLVTTDLDGDARPEVTYRGADEAAGSPLSAATLSVAAWLQGAADGSAMRTDLRDAGLLPLDHPYLPLGYSGTESTTAQVLTDNAVVDWVLVEFRAAPADAPAERRAALLLADGSVVAADGGALTTALSGNHYVVVWHRNHLAAMTATAVPLGAADLTAGLYGLGGTEVAPGVWALTAGDADGDGSVLAGDRQSIWLPAVGQAGYLPADLNLDGSVLADDRQSFWTPNVGRASQVPGAASLTGDTSGATLQPTAARDTDS